jgi:hypothetical protein
MKSESISLDIWGSKLEGTHAKILGRATLIKCLRSISSIHRHPIYDIYVYKQTNLGLRNPDITLHNTCLGRIRSVVQADPDVELFQNKVW